MILINRFSSTLFNYQQSCFFKLTFVQTNKRLHSPVNFPNSLNIHRSAQCLHHLLLCTSQQRRLNAPRFYTSWDSTKSNKIAVASVLNVQLTAMLAAYTMEILLKLLVNVAIASNANLRMLTIPFAKEIIRK